MAGQAIGGRISLGGGYGSPSGCYLGLYFMAALMLLSALVMVLLTRETIGMFKPRDRAPVSADRCLRGRTA
jgi:hypothetical protein